MATRRIDVHQHVVPDDYRELCARHGIEQAGGRDLPSWSEAEATKLMDAVGTETAIMSVSTPGVTFLEGDDAAQAARDLNEHTAEIARRRPDRFGFFATLPMPDARASLEEARHALDTLGADGVTLLANSNGSYLGRKDPEIDELLGFLDEREAVVFVHPASLPAASVEGIPPFATDFLLDTTRAAYLLVRNGARRTYPRIKFVLSHGGGMVPYISHRMAVAIMSDTGRNLVDVLEDLSGFYFDTALTSSPAALPTLLSFAHPGHVLFGSDWPFAPEAAALYFSAGLDSFEMSQQVRDGVDRDNALRLFPRLGDVAPLPPAPLPARIRSSARRAVVRGVLKLAARDAG